MGREDDDRIDEGEPEAADERFHRAAERPRRRVAVRLGYRRREPRLGASRRRSPSRPGSDSTRPSEGRKRRVPRLEVSADDPPSGTDYGKPPAEDPYLELGPSPWIAALLAFVFSGLGQLYNGRWLRGVGAMALPAGLLIAAAWSGSAVVYLMAFWAGALTAPAGLVLLIALFGWVPLLHPAVWMGLPMKVAVVLEAGYDARRIRRFRKPSNRRRAARIAYGLCLGLLLLTWMFTIGLTSVRQPYMNPVVEPGDHVVIDRMAFGLQLPLIGVRIGGRPIPRGERVAVLDPEGSGRLLLRRVFAVAGDRVAFGPPAGPARIRQPMLGPGGAMPSPVVWSAWPGPCVFALEVSRRKRGANYARCRAFVESAGPKTYRVSYPRYIEPPGGGKAWEGRSPAARSFCSPTTAADGTGGSGARSPHAASAAVPPWCSGLTIPWRESGGTGWGPG